MPTTVNYTNCTDCCTTGVTTCCCPQTTPVTLTANITVGGTTYQGTLSYSAITNDWRGSVDIHCSQVVSIIVSCNNITCLWTVSLGWNNNYTGLTGCTTTFSCNPLIIQNTTRTCADAGNPVDCPANFGINDVLIMG